MAELEKWGNSDVDSLVVSNFFFFGNLQDFIDYSRVRGEPMPEIFGDLRREAFPSSPKIFPAAAQE